MKKHAFKALFLLITLLLIFISWSYFIIPREEIKGLKAGYVDVSYKQGKVSYKFVSKRPKRWIKLKSIKKNSVNAIMISEDWNFYQHNGIDTNQLKKAITKKLNGHKLRGASTISQQLVKNLFLSFERSFIRKYKELIITLYLEKKLSKDKILEIYLNIIEYGKNIHGIEKASRKYFSHGARSLNVLEASFLAMLLPNPIKYAQSFKDKKLTKYARSTMYAILEKMKQAKMISKKQLKSLMKMKLNFERRFKKNKGLGPRSFKVGKRKENLDDGSSYERRYREDLNLKIDDGPEFDPDTMIEDESGLEEEFKVD